MKAVGPLAAGNPGLKQLRRLLGRRSARRDDGCFVVEGPLLVEEAVAAGAGVEAIYVGQDLAGRLPWLDAVSGAHVHMVEAGVLEGILSTETPRPVAALVSLQFADLEDVVTAGGTPLVLILDGVTDPGNAGTLLRTAEATGATVVFGPGSVDPFNPKCVRAAAGALFRVPVAEDSHGEIIRVCRSSGLDLVGTDPRSGLMLDALDLRGPTALVLGSESHGVSGELGSAIDLSVRIPMAGDVESLNVATTGAVLAFEAARQRRFA